MLTAGGGGRFIAVLPCDGSCVDTAGRAVRVWWTEGA